MIGLQKNRKEMLELKKLLVDYRTLLTEQVYAYFDYKQPGVLKNMLATLQRESQLVFSKGGERLARNIVELEDGYDPKIIAAFWVLLYCKDGVTYHSRCDFPSQICFFVDGTDCEIVYVGQGDEAMINTALSHPQDDTTHYIVIVEDPEQILQIEIPRILWFCTVGGDGHLERYVQEDHHG